MTTAPPDFDLAMLAPAYWPEVRRGTERVIRLQADGLQRAGLRPKLFCGASTLLPQVSIEDGLEVHRLPRLGKRRLWRQQRDDNAAYLPSARLALLRSPPDIVHLFYPTDALLMARLPASKRPPYVASVMGPPDRAWAVSQGGRLEGLLEASRSASVITSLSKFAAERLWNTFAIKSEIVAPPVDLQVFSPGPGGRRPTPTVLFASDPSSGAKRIDLLIEAAEIARARVGELQLLVNRPKDEKLATELDSIDGLELVDLDNQDALVSAYRSSWVTALPSFNEAFGLVVAESLACGTPAVAFSGEGPAELIEHGVNGFVADKPNAGALAIALIDAVEVAQAPATADICVESVAELGVGAYTEKMLQLFDFAIG